MIDSAQLTLTRLGPEKAVQLHIGEPPYINLSVLLFGTISCFPSSTCVVYFASSSVVSAQVSVTFLLVSSFLISLHLYHSTKSLTARCPHPSIYPLSSFLFIFKPEKWEKTNAGPTCKQKGPQPDRHCSPSHRVARPKTSFLISKILILTLHQKRLMHRLMERY